MNYQFRSRLLGNIQSCLRPKMVQENLILLGDCFQLYGSHFENSKRLRDYISQTWENVYVVPGMTEFAGSGIRNWVRNIDNFQEFIAKAPGQNMIMLNNTEIHCGDHVVIGSTFWAGAGPASKIIEKYPQFPKKYIEQWANEDAQFIGTMIKNATLSKKRLVIGTYYAFNQMDTNNNKIITQFINNADLEQINGRWACA